MTSDILPDDLCLASCWVRGVGQTEDWAFEGGLESAISSQYYRDYTGDGALTKKVCKHEVHDRKHARCL